MEVRDRREQELPDVRHLWLVDPETGRRLQVDTRRSKTRETFAAVAVTVPNELGELQTVSVAPDRETLQEIAEQTGGRYFDAPTQADLDAVYEAIGSQVAWDEEEREVTVAFAGAGAVLLLVASSLSALWFGRLP